MSDSPISKRSDLNAGLSIWCRLKGVDASTFAAQTGFSYMHAWRLLSGKSPVTAETLGRFVLAYGHEAVGELISLAEKSDSDHTTNVTQDEKLPGGHAQK